MGLFADAKKYGGEFYRCFSQSFGSDDLDVYFQDDPVIQHGICAGCSLDWLEFYLTLPENSTQRYSNERMYEQRNKILTIQKALRKRDQSLSDLVIEYGLIPHHLLPGKYVFTQSRSAEIANLSTSVRAVNIISYVDPDQGRHVAVYFVDKNKNLFFMDTHKGDVVIPYPGSSKWLEKYFSIFLDKSKEIEISQFKAEWNSKKASLAFRSLAQDAITYSPRQFGVRRRSRSVGDDDFDNVKMSRAFKQPYI